MDFSKRCQEWLGVSQGTSRQLALIGSSEKLMALPTSLPQSWMTLYELTTLPDEVFDSEKPDFKCKTVPGGKNRKSIKTIKSIKSMQTQLYQGFQDSILLKSRFSYDSVFIVFRVLHPPPKLTEKSK